MDNIAENTIPMHNPNFSEGNNHLSLLMTCLTVLLYGISAATLNQIAAICTIIAALSTAALNISRFLKKK